MRSAAGCVVVWFLMASAVFAAPEVASRPVKPRNVLFVVADDLNCRIGCYGDATTKTPNIDRLARRGVVFEKAYCQFPLCSPSRSSFLTGKRPDTTRITRNPGAARTKDSREPTPHFREFIPETVTLPQFFKSRGFHTARIGKLYHYGVPAQIGTNGLDDDASWDERINTRGRDKWDEDQIFSLQPGQYGGTVSWLAAEGTDSEQTDALAATSAVEYLERHRRHPFFLAVGFYRPHTPYVAPKSYFAMYPSEKVALPLLGPEDQSRNPAPAFGSAKPDQDKMSDDQRRQAIQAYQASITFMDAQLGRLLDALDRLGLADETVVTFTSDHGYHLHDHGLWQKMSLFEDSTRVPLIVSAPGMPANCQSTPALAELVDLYPTLVDLFGYEVPADLEGHSQKPVLEGRSSGVKQAAFTQVTRGKFDGHSVRTERYRYTLWGDGTPSEQLHDLQADPDETTNLAGKPELAAVVKTHRALVEGQFPKGR
jgi:iduronate 2-sulfatase